MDFETLALRGYTFDGMEIIESRERFSPDGNLRFFHGWSKGEDITVDDPGYYRIRLDGSDLTKLDENGYGLVYSIWST